MKNLLLISILCISVLFPAGANSKEQVGFDEQNNLPNIEINTTNNQTDTPIKQDVIQIKKTQPGQKPKPAFNPKNSGLTNYQYDDKNYKYYKFEKYIKDNIEYSKSGSTTLY